MKLWYVIKHSDGGITIQDKEGGTGELIAQGLEEGTAISIVKAHNEALQRMLPPPAYLTAVHPNALD